MAKTVGCARKGQTSLELMIVTAIGLAIVGAIFAISITYASDTTRSAQASDAVEKIVKSADLVYALGPGSKTSVDVLMPDGIRNASVYDSRVVIRVGLSSGDADVFSLARENLSGSLTNRSGRQTVTLTVNSSGSVIVNSTG
ncbi:Uncharacterised protein [uncultured archaeon]|nr:Uncharacterised protein [uncultured archaeon]